MKTIFVNASSIASGGALSILTQVCAAFEKYGYDMDCTVFCPPGLERFERERIHIAPVDTNLNWGKRIAWDLWGMRKYVSGKKPDCIISLQNTGTRGFGKTKQMVYIHQPLPFSSEIKWSLLRKSERLYWFYRYVYKQMIRFSIPPHAQITVQTDWMKSAVMKDFNKTDTLVHKFRPCITSFDIDDVVPFDANEQAVFFYPTSPPPYKNMELLYKALVWCNQNVPDNSIKLVLTLTPDDALIQRLSELGVMNMIDFVGSIPYSEVLQRYASARALVFPSLVETFGLPLLEAARFGIPVLAPDLPYAREVCGEYKGVSFLPKNDAGAWGQAIVNLASEERRLVPPLEPCDDDWKHFIEWIRMV